MEVIEFYSSVCVPLFWIIARLYSPLIIQPEAFQVNLDRWKELAKSLVCAESLP
jgi:hypothetical protein